MAPKIPGGYFLFPRIFQDFLIDKPPVWAKLFLWMLSEAQFKESKRYKRGQFKTTIKEMQEAASYIVGYRKEIPTVRQTRNFYEGLAKVRMIDTTKVTHGMIITIRDYDLYQNPKSYERHTEGHNEGHAKGKEVAQYNRNECSNEGKGKKDRVLYPEWLNISLWNEFKKMRVKIKAPLTAHAEKLNITKLKKLIGQGYNQDEVINQTIAGSWKGFYPVKSEDHGLEPKTYAQAQDAERRRRAKWVLDETKRDSNESNNGTDIKRISHA